MAVMVLVMEPILKIDFGVTGLPRSTSARPKPFAKIVSEPLTTPKPKPGVVRSFIAATTRSSARSRTLSTASRVIRPPLCSDGTLARRLYPVGEKGLVTVLESLASGTTSEGTADADDAIASLEFLA